MSPELRLAGFELRGNEQERCAFAFKAEVWNCLANFEPDNEVVTSVEGEVLNTITEEMGIYDEQVGKLSVMITKIGLKTIKEKEEKSAKYKEFKVRLAKEVETKEKATAKAIEEHTDKKKA